MCACTHRSHYLFCLLPQLLPEMIHRYKRDHKMPTRQRKPKLIHQNTPKGAGEECFGDDLSDEQLFRMMEYLDVFKETR